jgi:uncharacterized membrane protein YedE/YeeE
MTKKSIFSRPEKPYVNPYFGGVVLGIVLFLSLFLTGNGLGSSGGTTRLVAFAEDLINPAHVDRTPYLLLMAFLGGTIFLYGARMARGCTSGQALTGGATLAAGSWAIMFAIFGGAYALAYFVRKLWL